MSAINSRAVQCSAQVVSNKKVGAYHHIILSVDSIAAAARPGNFVAIAVGGASSSLVLLAFLCVFASLR